MTSLYVCRTPPMIDQDACMAEHAAADEDAERWYAAHDDATTVETDLC